MHADVIIVEEIGLQTVLFAEMVRIEALDLEQTESFAIVVEKFKDFLGFFLWESLTHDYSHNN